MAAVESATATPALEELESHRRELTAYCYRMLASPFEAEDAVQETLLRARRARERAVLILCEVLRWQASEVAELLETTVASVNSALQRARATLESADVSLDDPAPALGEADRELLARFVEAFEAYDIDRLTALIHEDATQSMPPYDLWLAGRDDIFDWWFGPGIGCKGSRVIPIGSANGSPAFGQYKPSSDGGYEPWALIVLETSDGRIGELTFVLDTTRLFPLFGLPPRLDP